LFTALGLGALAGTASANAFNINEHDARLTGRGDATAASDDTPAAIFANIAGISIADGTNISLGTSVYIAEGSYENPDTQKVKTDGSPSVVPQAYITSRVHDMVAIGIGFHLPFGLAVSWPDNHAQKDLVQDQNLRTFFITPSVGLNLHKQVPGLTLGAGLDLVPATVELENKLEFGDTEGNAHLAGTAFGVGFRAGVMYHPPAVAGLKLGVMYKSKVKLDFKGNGDFDVAAPFRDQLPPDGDIETTINLPQSIVGGVAYSPVKNLEVEGNVVWINWSKAFPDNNLTITLPDGSLTSAPQGYSDTTSFRLGVDYALPAQKMNVRAGFIYDPTPIDAQDLTARLPDIDRKIVTVGASRQFGNYGGHLGLLWVLPGERDTSPASGDPATLPAFKGTYGVQAFVISLGFSAKFGGEAPPPSQAGTIAQR